jgi:hypothetical protein
MARSGGLQVIGVFRLSYQSHAPIQTLLGDEAGVVAQGQSPA